MFKPRVIQFTLSLVLHDANATQVFKSISLLRVCTISAILIVLLCPNGAALLPFLRLTWVFTGEEAALCTPTICHTHLDSKSQLESYSKIPAASFPLIAHLKPSLQGGRRIFFCIYSEHVVTIASSYFFGANKKLLIFK